MTHEVARVRAIDRAQVGGERRGIGGGERPSPQDSSSEIDAKGTVVVSELLDRIVSQAVHTAPVRREL